MPAPRLRLLALLLALLAPACGKKNEFRSPPPPHVTVSHPQSHAVVDSIDFTGTTRARARVDLRARVNGYLEQIAFEDGDDVAKGDLLFQIEQAPFLAAIDAAEADLQKAQASLQLEQAQTSRIHKLARRQVSAQSDVDIQEAELATARADVAAAEAALKQARLELGYTEIRAPIDGRIGRHLVDVGNLVQAEQTRLATIETIDPIEVDFYVSETDLLRFMEMLRQNRLPNPAEKPPVLNLGLANEQGFPHKGHLTYRELGVDPGTGTILRRAVFPNPDGTLIPGLFVRIRAQLGEPEARLLVPEQALGADQRGDFLLVVRDDDVVEYRPVQPGVAVGSMRVIRSGIDEDDWVIVNGLQRARPGAKVNPQRVDPTPLPEEALSAAKDPPPPATDLTDNEAPEN